MCLLSISIVSLDSFASSVTENVSQSSMWYLRMPRYKAGYFTMWILVYSWLYSSGINRFYLDMVIKINIYRLQGILQPELKTAKKVDLSWCLISLHICPRCNIRVLLPFISLVAEPIFIKTSILQRSLSSFLKREVSAYILFFNLVVENQDVEVESLTLDKLIFFEPLMLEALLDVTSLISVVNFLFLAR